jgi:hypothetical protein
VTVDAIISADVLDGNAPPRRRPSVSVRVKRFASHRRCRSWFSSPTRPSCGRARLRQIVVRDLPDGRGPQALEDEVQAVLNGKKKADQAVRDAQRKADELLPPYVEQTALKLP